jgi:hypothetical protein
VPRGQPTFDRFDERRREKYLSLLRKGKHRLTAARACDVSRELVRLYRNANPSFAEEESAAEEEAGDAVEDALFEAARDGNVTAIQVYLYNRRPARWKDQRNLKVFVGDDDLDSAIERELARVARGGQAADARAAEAQGGDGA